MVEIICWLNCFQQQDTVLTSAIATAAVAVAVILIQVILKTYLELGKHIIKKCLMIGHCPTLPPPKLEWPRSNYLTSGKKWISTLTNQYKAYFQGLVPKVGIRSRPPPPIWKMPKHKSLLLLKQLEKKIYLRWPNFACRGGGSRRFGKAHYFIICLTLP